MMRMGELTSGIAVVIPSFNAAATLPAQLAALAGQRYEGELEVLVSDNGSTDGTLDVVRGWQDRLPVRVVDASDRRGAGHARNVGAAAASMDLIAYCDAD